MTTSEKGEALAWSIVLAIFLFLVACFAGVQWYRAGVQADLWTREGIEVTQWEVFTGAKPAQRLIEIKQ